MRKRKQGLINVYAFLITGAFALLIGMGLMDDGEGLKVNSMPVSKRVSARMVNKSVSEISEKVAYYGEEGREDGSANIVTSIVVNYRAFDTLGEIIVLFASAAGVGLLLSARKKKNAKDVPTEASDIIKTAIPIINLVVFTVGAIIILYGHITPGGGFPGGAVIATGIILMSLVFKNIFNRKVYLILESVAGVGILVVGLLGMSYGDGFLANFLPTGKIGGFLSSGTVLILYILVGIKVAVEIANISSYFVAKRTKHAGEEKI